MEFFALLGQILNGPENKRFVVDSVYHRRRVALSVHPSSAEPDAPLMLAVTDLGPLPAWEQRQAEERARRWPPLTDPLLVQVIAERRAAGLYS